MFLAAKKLSTLVIVFALSYLLAYAEAAERGEAGEVKKILVKQKEIIDNQSKLLDSNFWIARKKDAHKTILDAPAIAALNKKIVRSGYLLNPLNLGKRVSSKLVVGYLKSDLNLMYRYIKYDLLGKRYRDPEFSNHLAELIDLAGIKKKTIQVKYGLTIRNVNVRFFPTHKTYVRKKASDHFDIMQKTHLGWNSPVAILHVSKDKKWYLVETIYVRGWVEKKAIALMEFETLKDYHQHYLPSKNNLITTQAKNFIYASKEAPTPLREILAMGTRLKLDEKMKATKANEGKAAKRLPVLLPKKSASGGFILKTFFIESKDVHQGYLTFNQKNLIEQSFKFLNLPYSWGGSAHGVDCSLFLVRVFNSFGIRLPRASILQKKIFNQTIEDTPKNHHFPQIAFLSSPNHIMLFLGSYQARDYYIHSLWSFYDQQNNEFEVKSVIVSDSELGHKSHLGSLEQRMRHKGKLNKAIN